jgi:hypothetical protein
MPELKTRTALKLLDDEAQALNETPFRSGTSRWAAHWLPDYRLCLWLARHRATIAEGMQRCEHDHPSRTRSPSMAERTLDHSHAPPADKAVVVIGAAPWAL